MKTALSRHQQLFQFRFRFLFLFLFLFASPSISSARTLLDDNDSAVMDAPDSESVSESAKKFSEKSSDSDISSFFRKSKKKSSSDADAETDAAAAEVRAPYKEAESAMELRKIRRVALGLQAAGALGVGGALMELAFSPQWSFNAGYGGGSGFQAVEFQGKYVLAGDWLMPYMSFGYSRWINSGNSGPIAQTTPSILGDRLLSASEKASGEFQKNLIYPGIGLQFMQLSGDWAGASVYAELTVLLDMGAFVAAPTGAIGFLYYF